MSTKCDRRRKRVTGGIRGESAIAMMEDVSTAARSAATALKSAQNTGKSSPAAKKRKIDKESKEPRCDGCKLPVSDCNCGGDDGPEPDTDDEDSKAQHGNDQTQEPVKGGGGGPICKICGDPVAETDAERRACDNCEVAYRKAVERAKLTERLNKEAREQLRPEPYVRPIPPAEDEDGDASMTDRKSQMGAKAVAAAESLAKTEHPVLLFVHVVDDKVPENHRSRTITVPEWEVNKYGVDRAPNYSFTRAVQKDNYALLKQYLMEDRYSSWRDTYLSDLSTHTRVGVVSSVMFMRVYAHQIDK